MIRILIAVLILLTFSAPASAKGRTFRLSLVAAIAAHTADITTTAYCLGQGTCREANPALRWAEDKPVALGLTKGAMAGSLQLIPAYLARHGHEKWAIVFNVAQTVAFTGIAMRNARMTEPRK